MLTIPNLFTSNNANVSGKLTYKNTNYHDRTNSLFGTFSLGYKGMVYVDGSLRNDWISAWQEQTILPYYIFYRCFSNSD